MLSPESLSPKTLSNHPYLQMRNKQEVKTTLCLMEAYANANEVAVKDFTSEDEDVTFDLFPALHDEMKPILISEDGFIMAELTLMETFNIQTELINQIKSSFPDLLVFLHDSIK